MLMNFFVNHVKKILAQPWSDNPSTILLSKKWELSFLKILTPLNIFKFAGGGG